MSNRSRSRLRRTLGATLVAGLVVGGASAASETAAAGRPAAEHGRHAEHAEPDTGCHLGHGVKHVISLVFDNVHFARDNPNVPSDLEQMPHLLHFLEHNGTVLSNLHTPMIAHTADDSLTIYTGLYGDRHGQPLTNSYKTYNPDGTTDPAASFAYWTSPVVDTASSPTNGHDTLPTMAYSPTTPATRTNTGQQTPAPWVPYTRAGCTVGNFSTANMVLENTRQDISTVFGAGSPEEQQLNADTADPYKDNEVADYIGVAVHCAKGDQTCADAKAVKYGQSTPTPSARPDLLPTEPGGYHGYQALFGARYVAPQLGAGTPDLTHHGYQVTNSSGNLVDLNGAEMDGQYTAHRPGFPGFNPSPAQSLAYVADMQEAGIPVTYGYISDLHERKAGTTGNCTTATATGTGNPVGPGDSCYVANAKAYDAAFGTFFQRLTKDGITPANTLYLISSEEGDQFAGANAGRAMQPTPAGCDGVTVPCQYASGQLGELQANIKGLLSTTPSASTPFDIEPQGASIYVHGQPAANDPAVRQLERDTAAMTADNRYSGAVGQHIVNYQAGAAEQRILHMQTSDPLRTPTYSLFPVPDYYFSTSGPNLSVNSAYAWNHGYYSPNIDITWAGFAGPGVAADGVNGPQPANGNEASDPNSTRTVPQASGTGTYVDEVDLRPTLLHLAGLHDDYQTDGAVISQILRSHGHALRSSEQLAAVYRQLNSSVGDFGTDTLLASTDALKSGSSSSDATYTRVEAALTRLADQRDRLATHIKTALAAAADGRAVPRHEAHSWMCQARDLLAAARQLAASS